MGFLLFIFFLIVFFLLLGGGYILKTFRDLKKAAEQAADMKQQRSREEVGRQRQQYSQRQGTQNAQSSQNGQTAQGARSTESPFGTTQKEEARHTQTATGETIIDHHHEQRGSRKIFDDSDGEYVDFVEE